jgi:hypothetical protein
MVGTTAVRPRTLIKLRVAAHSFGLPGPAADAVSSTAVTYASAELGAHSNDLNHLMSSFRVLRYALPPTIEATCYRRTSELRLGASPTAKELLQYPMNEVHSC